MQFIQKTRLAAGESTTGGVLRINEFLHKATYENTMNKKLDYFREQELNFC